MSDQHERPGTEPSAIERIRRQYDDNEMFQRPDKAIGILLAEIERLTAELAAARRDNARMHVVNVDNTIDEFEE